MRKASLLLLIVGTLFTLLAIAALSWLVNREDSEDYRVPALKKARAVKAAKKEEREQAERERDKNNAELEKEEELINEIENGKEEELDG